MRYEAETLLKMIGEERDYGTHGAKSIINLFKDVMIDDFQGAKEALHCCGYDLSKFNVKKCYQAILELTPFVPQMSTSAFERFLDISYDLKYLTPELGNKLKIALPIWSNEQSEKRAQFYKYAGDMTLPLFTYEELKQDKEVLEKYPWRWFRAMHHYPQQAENELITYLKLKQKPKPEPAPKQIDFYTLGMLFTIKELEEQGITTIRQRLAKAFPKQYPEIEAALARMP